ncbi:MAG TPA: phospholipase D family protein [Burkholderiaceae bacterium]|jgi:putative cardiolipin synthase|nr:phospholipase D family protein [Burkholderiaceae bacterium]
MQYFSVLRIYVNLTLLFCAVALGGCASLPDNNSKTASLAFNAPYESALGKIALASTPADNVDQSGFRLIPLGSFAFNTRIELIRRAQHTLDLQYYVIANDESGRMLFKELTAAAARGVRVRLLVDDLYTTGQDQTLLSLSHQPNIEVRLFNPFPAGRSSLWSKFLLSASDFKRINHRMHNKLFVADNVMAVTGGRNIGNEYFMYATVANFIDMDVFVVGDIVRDLSEVFDRYWNSAYVYPISVFVSDETNLKQDTPVAPDFGISQGRDPLPPDAVDVLDYKPLAYELEQGKVDLIWAPATVFADSPLKVMGLSEGSMHVTVSNNLMHVMSQAQEEVIVISPYFIPGKIGMEGIRQLSQRHVRMILVTNSLAATDAPLVHIGYSHYRAEMIKLGVEIYEINPLRVKRHKGIFDFGSSRAMLHAKIAVIDHKQVFVGSMNSDPRSSRQNTEMGIIIQSPKMAMQIIKLMQSDDPAGTFKLRKADKPNGFEWVAIDGENSNEKKEEVLDDEPGAGMLLKLSLQLLTPFAPEELF